MTAKNFPAWSAAGLFLLCFLVYLPGRPGSFHFDDYHSLVNNPALFQSGISDLFRDPSLFSGLGVPVYRPLTLLSFSLQGRQPLRAGPLFLVNVFLHAACAALVFLFASLLFRQFLPALLSGLVFGLHPLATQAVNYISCRSIILASCFTLAAFSLLLSASPLQQGQGGESCRGLPPPPKPPAGRWFPLLAGGAMFGSGLLAKEEVFGAPLIFLMLALFLGGRRRKALIQGAAMLGLAAALYLILRWAVEVAVLIPSRPLRPLGANLATGLRAQFHYFALFLWPVNLSAVHEFTPSARSADPAALSALALWSAVLFLGLRRRKKPVFLLGFFWFLVGLAPSATLVALRSPLAEHHAYFSMIGPALIAGEGLNRLLVIAAEGGTTGRSRLKTAGLIVTLLLLFFCLIARTMLRCKEWRTEEGLWRSAAARAPRSSTAWVNLGVEWWEQGKVKRSRTCFEKALRLEPGLPAAGVNLGRIYLDEGRTEEALELLVAAQKQEPENPQINYNLARAYALTGRYRLAEVHYLMTLRFMPSHFGACEGLARLYVRHLRERRKAEEVITKCLAQRPGPEEISRLKQLIQEMSNLLPRENALMPEPAPETGGTD